MFHDVDFYIESKDRVGDFDPFLPKAMEEQFLSKTFKPIPIREDSIIGQ